MMPPLPTYASDIKDPNMVLDTGKEEEVMTPPPVTRTRKFVAGFACVALLYLFVQPLFSTITPATFGHMPSRRPCHPHQSVKMAPALVPLEAHIMSKCSDAQDCLKLMVLPTMQRVMDKVNFTLSYIGTPTDNDGVDCMHGPEECMGNIIELCAAKLYPSPKTYLGFTMCLTRDYHSIPQKSLIEDCALEHGIDFSKLNECSLEDNGGTGVGLLRDSVRRSIDAGVTASCTIRLNEEIYCIRDDGKWRDCPAGPGVNDLVIAIEKHYRAGSSEERISPSRAH